MKFSCLWFEFLSICSKKLAAFVEFESGMAESDGEEFGKMRKMKARTRSLGDGPSSFPSFSPDWRGRRRVDGTIDGGGGGAAASESDGGEEYEFPAEEGSWDPLAVFGSGIMMMILNKLDARSVALARLVSRGWLVLASSDKIWAPKVPLLCPLTLMCSFLVFPCFCNISCGLLIGC